RGVQTVRVQDQNIRTRSHGLLQLPRLVVARLQLGPDVFRRRRRREQFRIYLKQQDSFRSVALDFHLLEEPPLRGSGVDGGLLRTGPSQGRNRKHAQQRG